MIARFRLLPIALALVLVLGLAGCASSSETTGTLNLDTTADLVAYLESEGITLQSRGIAVQPFFTGEGEEYTVPGGGLLQVYEYDNAAMARADAARIDINQLPATPGPNFYRQGPLLVAYLGDDPAVELALADALGPQLL